MRMSLHHQPTKEELIKIGMSLEEVRHGRALRGMGGSGRLDFADGCRFFLWPRRAPVGGGFEGVACAVREKFGNALAEISGVIRVRRPRHSRGHTRPLCRR